MEFLSPEVFLSNDWKWVFIFFVLDTIYMLGNFQLFDSKLFFQKKK